MGRTQLQDAVPMTLGQEFGMPGRRMLGEDEVPALGGGRACLMREVNMGGTAIGTGTHRASPLG